MNFYLYALANPLINQDPKGLDTVGCDVDTLKNGRETPCRLECCAIHDKCYDDNECSSGSWPWPVGNWNKSRCDKTPECGNCNTEARQCFVQCRLSKERNNLDNPTRPNYYCAKEHRFVSIPGTFSSVEKAEKACMYDHSRDCKDY